MNDIFFFNIRAFSSQVQETKLILLVEMVGCFFSVSFEIDPFGLQFVSEISAYIYSTCYQLDVD